ncbi:MAG: PH domain-containing protein [Acidimicrobiales bacterium]
MLYDDGRIACDEHQLIIRWYYLWGSKKIPYTKIRSVERRQMSALTGKWRIWGSGDFVHWWNLDPMRPSKTLALEIHRGFGRIVPTISPDDPDSVEGILQARISK